MCATFPLVWIGALVTTRQAGMSVPDWPNTYGYNLFLYPISTWLAGPWNLMIEHGHRLLGAAVGLITIGVVAVTWREPRLRGITLFALTLVIGQGVLGGMRVRLDELALARIHGCVGPLFFATAVTIAVMTSRLWQDASQNQFAPTEPDAAARKLQRLALLTAILVYLQLVVGAFLRHVAVDALPGSFSTAVVFHLLLAGAVAVHANLLLYRVIRSYRQRRELVRPATWLGILVGTQLMLGGATWFVKYGLPAGMLANWPSVARWTNTAGSLGQSMIVTAHVAVGSLILATSVVLFLRSWRVLGRSVSGAVVHRQSLGMAL